jgi:hypothetical protein
MRFLGGKRGKINTTAKTRGKSNSNRSVALLLSGRALRPRFGFGTPEGVPFRFCGGLDAGGAGWATMQITFIAKTKAKTKAKYGGSSLRSE